MKNHKQKKNYLKLAFAVVFLNVKHMNISHYTGCPRNTQTALER